MKRISLKGVLDLVTETFGVGRSVLVSGVCVTGVVLAAAIFWFFRSAPPTSLTISCGPEGSIFHTNAVKYQAILARSGVKLTVLTSQGSIENLYRLQDPESDVDVGFVQGGVTNGLTNGVAFDRLMSLGSVAYQPLLVFYRSATPAGMLSEFAGKRLAIGPLGSGTRALALTLLATNGIVPGGPTTLLGQGAAEAATALEDGKIDVLFLMGGSASAQVMRKLLRHPEIQLLDFRQADGYSRRFSYLNKLEMPAGSKAPPLPSRVRRSTPAL